MHLISTLGWANQLAFQGKLDIRNPRIEQLRYKVKNPVAKKLKTMDSFSQPFAGCEPQRPFKRLCGFCVDYVNYRFIPDMSIYNDLYIKCHFTKPEALEADPPHGPKMTWSHGRCRRRSSCSECEQCDGMGVIRPLTRDSSWAVVQLGRAAGGSSLGCGCCGYPKFFLGKLHMRLKQKSLEGREFRDKWYVD